MKKIIFLAILIISGLVAFYLYVDVSGFGIDALDFCWKLLEEYQVAIDPARLQAFGLALNDVSQALSAANTLAAVGRLEDHYKLYLVIADTRLQSLEQIRQTVLHTSGNAVVRLEDVAQVSQTTAPQWQRVNADGHDAVLFQIYQQPSGNSVQIARDVKAKLKASVPKTAQQA